MCFDFGRPLGAVTFKTQLGFKQIISVEPGKERNDQAILKMKARLVLSSSGSQSKVLTTGTIVGICHKSPNARRCPWKNGKIEGLWTSFCETDFLVSSETENSH